MFDSVQKLLQLNRILLTTGSWQITFIIILKTPAIIRYKDK